jgi:hypothetical protein
MSRIAGKQTSEDGKWEGSQGNKITYPKPLK